MNKQLTALLASMSLFTCVSAQADDLGINVILEGEVTPGVYGRVELGNDSHPHIFYPEPRIAIKDSRYARYKPVYLHVPPGHAKNWDKHCHKYHACERPVYFIRSLEYEDSYQREHNRDYDRDHDRDHDRDYDRDHDSKKSDNKGGHKDKGNGKDKGNKH